MRDFKNIFDGLVDFIPIHEIFLANLTRNQGLENFLLAISQLVRSNQILFKVIFYILSQTQKTYILINLILQLTKNGSPL